MRQTKKQKITPRKIKIATTPKGLAAQNLEQAQTVNELKRWQIIYLHFYKGYSLKSLSEITNHTLPVVTRIAKGYKTPPKLTARQKGKLEKLKLKQDKQLSERDKRLIQMISNGMKSREIAYEFGLSQRTVEGLRQTLYRKIGVNKVAEVLMYAVKHKLIR
ncbi:MAG: response regulator transcription factor [Bacteroidetes bacterium]|nr:response regulator transcription factor [Bacteroidota bacterium]